MKDIEFEIRMQLLRAQPNLSLTQANEMIADIARASLKSRSTMLHEG
jgi:hypothetical protein